MTKKTIHSKKLTQEALEAYFKECDPHIIQVDIVDYKEDNSGKIRTINTKTRQRPYTVSGVAGSIGLTTKEFRELSNPYYKIKEGKVRIQAPVRKLLIDALQRVEQYAETNLYTSGKGQGAQFILKNIGDWKDKIEHENPGLSEAVINLEKSLSKALSAK